jgi:NTP pyrophosphatase (non-canonical NTP hydrolase)
VKIVGLNQYQQLTRRSANRELSLEQQLLNYALGLNGEAAEIAELLVALDPRLAELASQLQQAAGRCAEHVKKTIFHRHPDHDTLKLNLRKELGDLQWYLAQAADVIGASLEDIATENIEKLQKRYPQGFSSKDSAERKDAA